MTRLPVALACLILAAILAAVAYVLARPRWGWDTHWTYTPYTGEFLKPHRVEFVGPYFGNIRNAPSVSRDSTAGWAEAGW